MFTSYSLLSEYARNNIVIVYFKSIYYMKFYVLKIYMILLFKLYTFINLMQAADKFRNTKNVYE